jgi:hypothetical protein
MARLMIHEVLDGVIKAKTKKEKIQILQDNKSLGLMDVLKGGLDKNIQFNLPEGTPPFETVPEEEYLHLDQVTKNLGMFVSGKADARLNRIKAQNVFINTLGSCHPKDAVVLCAMKDKNITGQFKGLTTKLVQEAFPGLL